MRNKQIDTAKHDFVTSLQPSDKACVLIYGDGGCGKTTFLTKHVPDPVAILNFDGRALHAVDSAQKEGRHIYFVPIRCKGNVSRLRSPEVKKIASTALDQTLRNLEWALEESVKGRIRTVGLDTFTELEDLITLAVRGRYDLESGDYGQSQRLINRQMLTIFDMCRQAPAHCVVLAKASQVWKNNRPVDEFVPQCSKLARSSVDWAGYLSVENKKRKGSGKAKVKFSLKIMKAGNQINELWSVYDSVDWKKEGPFQYACKRQYLIWYGEPSDEEIWTD